MPSFGDDLRQALVRSLLPQASTNPLRTIGLSPELLDLGLSDDELYEYCRHTARDLVKTFHQDRVGVDPLAVERQRRFGEAFESLKDREVFDIALQEFRQQRNHERSDQSSEASVAEAQRALLEEARAKLAAAEGLVKDYEKQFTLLQNQFFFHLKFRGAKLDNWLASVTSGVCILQAVRLHLMIFDSYEPCQPTSRSASVEHLVDKALASDELFPVIDWKQPDDRRRITANSPRSLPKTPKAIKLSEAYRSALKSLGKLMALRAPAVTTLSVRLGSVKVSSGFAEFGRYHYPIFGTLPLDCVGPSGFYRSGSSDIDSECIWRHLHPLLMEGSLLVCHADSVTHSLSGGIDRNLKPRYKVDAVVLRGFISDSEI